MDHIENDVPQPQDDVAFGFWITKRAPISSSVKSIVLFQHQIIARRIIQPDIILKPRTATAIHGHTQGLCLPRQFGNFRQPRKGTVCHARGKGQVHGTPQWARSDAEYMVGAV
jgi:hypothetical protein